MGHMAGSDNIHSVVKLFANRGLRYLCIKKWLRGRVAYPRLFIVLQSFLVSGAERLESDMMSLCRRAEELGASQVVPLLAEDVVVDERALLKCIAPLCLHYGRDLLCPPNVLPVSKFKEVLGRYHRAILVKLDVPFVNQADSFGTKQEGQSQLACWWTEI